MKNDSNDYLFYFPGFICDMRYSVELVFSSDNICWNVGANGFKILNKKWEAENVKTNNDKAVICLCWKTKKKCFTNYKDCLKFARRVEKNNTLRSKRYGSDCGRNLPKTAQREMSLYKRCKAIYVCKYCGFYHFSSINLKNK